MNDGDQQDPTDSGEFPPPTSGEDTTPAASTAAETTPTEATPTEATPTEVTAPDAVGDTAPVAATPVDEPTVTAPVAATPVDEPTAAAPVAAAPAATESARRKGVLVPVWALATVGSILLLLIGGIVGYAIGSDDADTNSRVATGTNRPGAGIPDIGNFFGPFDGNGNGGNGSDGDGGNDDGNGSGPSAPSGNGAFLGVAVRDSSNPAGAALVRVVPDSPAADAELRAGDVITAVDGKTVADASALTESIGAHDTGDEIEVTYRRDGDSKSVTVTLGDRTPTSTQ
jgi:membrane-associated protease RseP (regulator of RpoE activity)